MKANNILWLLIIFYIFPLSAQSEPEIVDRIVAIVNDKIILQSEVDETVGLYFTQTRQYPTEEEIQEARKKYLKEMIETHILVEEAKSAEITVQSSEVNQSLEETIKNIIGSFSSEGEFEEELAKEGLTLADLKRRYREDIRSQLLTSRLVDEKIRSQIEVSANDVRDLYEEKKDEIPESPEKVTLSHILIPIEISREAESIIKDRLNEIRQMAVDDQDFAKLAQQYSQGPAADNGGDLGFFGKGDMMPEIENAAFNLKVGEISEPVKTSLGYHIIKLNGRSENKISASHILLKIQAVEADTLQAVEMAMELYNRILKGENFADLATLYSADKGTRDEGGKLGTFPLTDLIPPYSDAVDVLKVGETSQPLLGDYGYHLIRLDVRESARKLSFEDIRDQLEDMVRQNKMKSMYDEWMIKLKEQNYIEIRSFE